MPQKYTPRKANGIQRHRATYASVFLGPTILRYNLSNIHLVVLQLPLVCAQSSGQTAHLRVINYEFFSIIVFKLSKLTNKTSREMVQGFFYKSSDMCVASTSVMLIN